MKAIEISEGQKGRLLEMVKKLFPEYTFQFYKPISKANMLVGFLNSNDSDVYDNCDIFVHWFEFCCTHLADKIYYPDGVARREIRSRVEYFFFQTFIDSTEGATSGYDHPIDFLYREFKKIKS